MPDKFAFSPAELVRAAINAMENSYAPYSNYKVGAALLSKNGRIYSGCNIENASYTPTVCAERTAFFKAVSAGEREFIAIAVVGGKDGAVEGVFPPCGVCRQVMVEFCEPAAFEVYLGKNANDCNDYEKYTLGELLPISFGKSEIIE